MNLNIYQVSVFSKVVCCFFLFLFSHQVFSQTCKRSVYRTIDGTCNNLTKKDWGSADMPLARVLPANYSRSNPNSGIITNRPNPRKISNEIFSQSKSTKSKNGLSSFVFTWGQFIDHDLGKSPRGTIKANIPLPSNEPDFTEDIVLTRSDFFPGTGRHRPAEQINELTSWIDGSQVYGSSSARARWLRTFKHGKLKTSKGDLLPYNTHSGEINGRIDPNAPEMDNDVMFQGPIFIAGDKRAGEHPALTTLHVLFVREHNRLCDLYRKRGISQDEMLYQLARKQVSAIIQAITYNEFLPALGIKISPYRGYNPSEQPDLLNVFANAAFRIGHTMVSEDVLIVGDDCNALRENLSIEEAFFNPQWIANFGIEPFVKGLAVQVQEEIDAKIVDGLRNFLFNIPQVPGTFGSDLAALNIQRGRDHGLQSYNDYREYFTGTKAHNFHQINSDPSVWQKLKTVYNDRINRIDPWVGMLAEAHLPNRNMGITAHNILKEQFERARDGDYYFYKNDPYFRRNDINEIDKTTLATIVKRNTPLRSIQKNLFKAEECKQTPPNNNDNVIVCNEITIEYGNGSISMEGNSNRSYYFQVFDKSWQAVDHCSRQCGHSKTINNLKNGTYRLIIFNANWRQICFQEVRLSGVTSVADVDKDGIAANKDCNDNDPNLTTVGAKCNDGNANTINDRVSKNCTCVGTPKETGITQVAMCNGLEIHYSNSTIRIDGIPNSNYKFKIERLSPVWKSIHDCTRGCGKEQVYDELSAGTYWIRVWTQRWGLLCDTRIELGPNNLITTASENARFVANLSKNTAFNSTLYPNPATNKIYLALTDFSEQKGSIRLLNNLGQLVQEKNISPTFGEPIALDIHALNSGFYQVQIVVEGQVIRNHKLVVER